MGDVWQRLALYESDDLVRRFYQERHNTKLSPAKARAIVAHFAQGRQYFFSARQADELIRPLLVYYGVLSLTRGLVLFKDVGTQSSNIA